MRRDHAQYRRRSVPLTAALLTWAVIGAGMSLVLTPVGRVLRRSARPADRPALFAAQFSLSHLCWLVAYPVAGWGATIAGFTATWTALTVLAAAGAVFGVIVWPRHEPAAIEHVHDRRDTAAGHLVGATAVGSGVFRHAHAYVIDADHARWPHAAR